MTGGGGGGAEINVGGHEKFIHVNSRGHLGTRSLFESGSNEKDEDPQKMPSVENFPQNLVAVSKFLRFSTNSSVKTKRKRSSSQKFYDIRCKSIKITKKQFLLANSSAVNTNLEVLGLDLRSSSPKPVNFFGPQPSLGGAQFSLG